MSPVARPQAPSAIASSIMRSIVACSVAVGGRRAKPMAARRSVPCPTSWATFSAMPSSSYRARNSRTDFQAKSMPAGR